jgi:CHAT domain-containing protein
MDIETCFREPKNKLELIYLDNRKIRLRLYKSLSEGPFLHYEENEIEIKKIDKTIDDINHFLTLINTLKEPKDDYFEQLQEACQILYFDLLGQKIKKSLHEIPSNESIKLIIDDKLLYIPWELLFDGQKFLFEQFSIGRQIATEYEKNIGFGKEKPNLQKSQLKMLILTDPNEDLENAYNEGNLIYEEFHKEKTIHIRHHSSNIICLDFVKKNLPHYDIVHFAGHVEYNSAQPNKSGWVLSDGIFSIKDIENICCSKVQMPTLIFCNACQSGSIDRYAQKELASDSHFLNKQLAPIFMRAGVKHYIGTFTKISDQYAVYIGIEFYRQLLQHGKNIGDSLKEAREIFRNKFETKSFSWINYVLYGEQDNYIIQQNSYKIEEKTRSVAPSHSVSHPKSDPIYFRKEWKWKILVGFLLLFLLIPAFLFIKGTNKEISHPTTEDKAPIEVKIDEARKAIYEILEAREGLKIKRKEVIPSKDSDIQKDKWTSTRLGMAIFLISDPSEGLSHWANKIIRSLNRQLTELFADDARLRLAERRYLDKILKEKALKLSDWPLDASDRVLFGKLLYARIMLFIEGCKESDGIYICYKLVDAEPGEILKSNSDIKLTKNAKTYDLAKMIYSQINKEIFINFPLRGRIKEIQNNIVTINIGSEVGVKPGHIFEILDSKENIIGKIMIKNKAINSKNAECEVIEGEYLSNGLCVRLIESS